MNRRNFNKKREIEYIPVGDEKALQTPVESLGLHPKTKELFSKNNILTVYDIAKRNEKQLFKIQGFGKKDLIGVERELGKLKISLAPLEEPKVKEKPEKVEKLDREKVEKNDKPNKTEKPEKTEKVEKQDKADKKKDKPKDKKQDKQKEQPQHNDKKKDLEFKRISKGEKFGIGRGNEVIIPPMYDEVFMVKEDMVCVDVDGLFGYVNMQNEMVIEPKYELAQSFSEGLANVMLNDLYGYIDKKGNVVIPFKYELATPFEEDGTARVKYEGRWGSITKDNKITWI